MANWRNLDFLGYPNYRVSTDGVVQNVKTGRILKQSPNNSGYLHVSLHNNGKATGAAVHYLVAISFIPNVNNKPQIDHINTIKEDNRVENLRWCTPHENMSNPITLKNNVEYHMNRKYSDETKEKLRVVRMGVSPTNKGTRWMNNGKDQMQVYPPWDQDMLIFGWQYGKLKRSK